MLMMLMCIQNGCNKGMYKYFLTKTKKTDPVYGCNKH